MPNGIVKWFNGTKGYGFIEPEDKSQDVFVHISAVKEAGMRTLMENQQISYEIETGKNGKTAAINLRAAGAGDAGDSGDADDAPDAPDADDAPEEE